MGWKGTPFRGYLSLLILFCWVFQFGIYNARNIGSYIIFRDSLFNNNYYCTDEFVDFVKQNSITGLKFTCAGITK